MKTYESFEFKKVKSKSIIPKIGFLMSCKDSGTINEVEPSPHQSQNRSLKHNSDIGAKTLS